jgi:hypothetical protein
MVAVNKVNISTNAEIVLVAAEPVVATAAEVSAPVVAPVPPPVVAAVPGQVRIPIPSTQVLVGRAPILSSVHLETKI